MSSMNSGRNHVLYHHILCWKLFLFWDLVHWLMIQSEHADSGGNLDITISYWRSSRGKKKRFNMSVTGNMCSIKDYMSQL
jgi:hypothetical protein